MILKEQVYVQATLLAGELTEEQNSLLEMLCGAACSYLESRLRAGLTSDDCKADFIAAASLLALGNLNSIAREGKETQVTIGDLTVKRDSSDAASNCLRAQAEMLMVPYLQDGFAFLGV